MVIATRVPQLREVTADGVLRLHLHPGQVRVWNSSARFVFMLAGTQGGKTSFLPHWLHREMTHALAGATPHGGIGDFLAGTSTYDLFKLKLLPEMRLVFEELLGIGRYWAGERILELREGLSPQGRLWAGKQDDRMWGRIILRSAEAPTGLESATIKAAVLDEVSQPEFSRDAWEAIQRRLSLEKGRVLAATTLYRLGWLKTDVFDRWEAGDKDYDVIQFDSTENPAFPQEEFERAQRTLPAWKFNMLYRGRFARPAGLVYDSFDERQCVIDRFPIPSHWLWYFGHDFGGSNPAALAFAQDPDTGLFYLVREYLPGAKPVPDQVEEFKEMARDRIVIRRAGGSHQEQGWRDDYTAQGWPIAEPSVTAVDVGIARIYALHRRNAIMVFRDCKRYLDEKLSYSYKLGEGYKATDEIENKSAAHLLDAERYALCGFVGDSARPRVSQRFSSRF